MSRVSADNLCGRGWSTGLDCIKASLSARVVVCDNCFTDWRETVVRSTAQHGVQEGSSVTTEQHCNETWLTTVTYTYLFALTLQRLTAV